MIFSIKNYHFCVNHHNCWRIAQCTMRYWKAQIILIYIVGLFKAPFKVLLLILQTDYYTSSKIERLEMEKRYDKIFHWTEIRAKKVHRALFLNFC